MTTHHDASTTSTSGWVEPGFESVRAAFEENFSGRGEVGAAFAATLDGKPIVDLWGGLADSEQSAPWREDTLVVVFSGTKALVATCILMLIDRQLLDLDEPVATYWPEFAANGKSSVLVSDVVSHQARMPAVRTPLDRAGHDRRRTDRGPPRRPTARDRSACGWRLSRDDLRLVVR